MTLMRDWTGLGERVQAIGSVDPKSDSRPHVALMSLPRLFGTELHTVPSICPYLTCAQPTQRDLAGGESTWWDLCWSRLGF